MRDDRLHIIIDAWEKHPWSFDPHRVKTITRHLPTGDYSLPGLEEQLALERKSIPDLVNSLTSKYHRFESVLTRFATYMRAAVVVEGTREDIISGNYYAPIPPHRVLNMIAHVHAVHNVPILFLGNREAAAEYAETFFRRFVSLRRGELEVVGRGLEPGHEVRQQAMGGRTMVRFRKDSKWLSKEHHDFWNETFVAAIRRDREKREAEKAKQNAATGGGPAPNLDTPTETRGRRE